MADATFTIDKDQQAFRIQYHLPYLEQRKKAHIFEVQSLPIIYGDRTYNTQPASNFVAIDYQKDYYMPMTYQEVRDCIFTSCLISSPMISKQDKSFCGLDAYFTSGGIPYANDACQYQIQAYKQPNKFITINNTTYFSVGQNVLLEMKCYRENVDNYYHNISGLGSFVMPKKCEMSIDKKLIVHQVKNSPNGYDRAEKLSITKVASPPEILLQNFMEKKDNDKRHFQAMKWETRFISVTVVIWISISILVIIVLVGYVQIRKRQKKETTTQVATLNGVFEETKNQNLDQQVIEVPFRERQSPRCIQEIDARASAKTIHSEELSKLLKGPMETFLVKENE